MYDDNNAHTANSQAETDTVGIDFIKTREQMLTFMCKDLPDQQWIFEDAIQYGSLNIIYAPPGAGKTWVALDMAINMAAGHDCCGWKYGLSIVDRPLKVLYMYYEQDEIGLQQRVRELLSEDKYDVAGQRRIDSGLEMFPVICRADDFRRAGKEPPTLDIGTDIGRRWVGRLVDDAGADVVIVDNMMSALTTRDTIDAETWRDLNVWLRTMSYNGKTIILIHHSGKANNGGYGSMLQNVNMNSVIEVRAAEARDDEQGTRIDLIFRKARDSGKPPNRSVLIHTASGNGKDDDDTIYLTGEPIELSRDERIREMRAAGMTMEAIGRELGISHQAVSRRCKKLGI